MSISSAGIEYSRKVQSVFEEIISTQGEVIRRVSQLMAQCISDGGVVHVFGTGHSQLIALESFHRAGSLAAMNAWLEVPLSDFYPGRGQYMERLTGYAEIILDYHQPKSGEVLILVSNSGINNVPIELALKAKERNLWVVAITNVAHSTRVSPRHASGQRLMDVVDEVIDTRGVAGDASIPLGDSGDKRVGPLSTVAGAFIINLLSIETTVELLRRGVDAPVYKSENFEGGSDHNAALIERYRSRIRSL